MPNEIVNIRAKGWRRRLAVLAAMCGAVLVVAATTAAAQSKPPAGCTLTPCLMLGPAHGDTYVFTGWESGTSPKIASIDLTVWTKGRPGAVRSSAGSCSVPKVGTYSTSPLIEYYNVTCPLHPARRAFTVCFKDRAGLEKLPTGHSDTAEFPQGGTIQAYAVQRVTTFKSCPIRS